MAHSFYTEFALSPDEKNRLLDIARQSINIGFQTGSALVIDTDQLTGNLSATLASFVTLTQFGELRGCMGNLQASEALSQSVANTAFNAAFRDPRFDQFSEREWPETDLEISVLSPLEPIQAINRHELLGQLKPQIDGLMLEDKLHRSTFLPKVWEKLEDPDQFLDQLMLKAGLPPGHWSETLAFKRYQTITFDSKNRGS